MLDLQVVHVRQTTPVLDIAMLQVVTVPAAVTALTAVSADNHPVAFFGDAKSVLVVSPQNISSVRLEYSHGTQLFTSATWELQHVLRITTKVAHDVIEVRVNAQAVPFVAISSTMLMCRMPEKMSSLEGVDLIISVERAGETSFFEYELPAQAKAVTGASKAVGHLVKLLLTTPGTDVFNPTEGGGLQTLIGQNIDVTDESSALAARVTAGVTRAAASLLIWHLMSKLPAHEKLAKIDVLGVSTDPVDPTSVTIAIRATMADKAGALINLAFGV